MQRTPASNSAQRLYLAAAWICGLLVAATALAASPADASASPPMLFRLAGRLHPLIVHFPIALLLTALIVEAFHVLHRQTRTSTTALVCLGLGVPFAACAIASGLANENYESHGAALAAAIDQHQLFGIIAGVVGALTFAFGMGSRSGRRAWRMMYLLGLLATGALTAITGHLGGSLVYGDDYLTSIIWPASNSKTTLAHAPIDDPPTSGNANGEIYFTTDILPIIENRCANCHGPSRQRGGLRLDAYDYIFHSDPSIWVVMPFDAESSQLLWRVQLPEGDEDAMPPKGDRLSAKEINLLEQWIVQGAKESPTAATDSQPVDANGQ